MTDKWKEALLLAAVAAIVIEFVLNAFHEQTLWHRMDSIEHRVDHLEQFHFTK